ncbi:P-loop containing nucleoside triphosphate hydrolase protein [Choanephora cucurbitarum]|nr:P-loop containing nucleoside triphosphate hydrolase protein [Choanephora cucurbitarum]
MSKKESLLTYFKVVKEQPATNLVLEKQSLRNRDPQLSSRSSSLDSCTNYNSKRQFDNARPILSDKSNCSVPHYNTTTIDLQNDFATLMDQRYTKEWRRERCCQYLMHHTSRNKGCLWKDKYMPDHIEGLIGQLKNYRYLLDWLNRLRTNTQQSNKSNIILLVGKHGIGKSASVQVAAKQAGYSIFEINSSSRRSGKNLFEKIGGMSDSHLVRFQQMDPEKKRKFEQRETIIIRDRVKKPKMDITRHFKPVGSERKETTPKRAVIESNISKQDIVKSNYKATESLILFEEVDILFEEDKGFWQSLYAISQKSKRPIIMTCNNDTLDVPYDLLHLQTTLCFDPPREDSLLPYLQLVCYLEGFEKVKHQDLSYIAELYGYDIRRILNALQLWLSNDTQKDLFAHIMGFSDLLSLHNSHSLADRLKGLNATEKTICKRYFFERFGCASLSTIEQVDHLLEVYSFIDAYVGLSDQRMHQIYDTDQYQAEKNDMQYTKMIYKNPTDLDHWFLEETMEDFIYTSNYDWSDPSLDIQFKTTL